MDESQFLSLVKRDVEALLAEAKEKIESGNGRALMAAMTTCLRGGLLPPDWLTTAFLDATERVAHGHAASWDEVFGKPHKKGSHRSAIKKKSTKSPLVWLDVHRAIKQGLALDDAMFEEVGRRHGLGKTLTAEYYYSFKERAERTVADSIRKAPEIGSLRQEEIMVGLATYLAYGMDGLDDFMLDRQAPITS